MDGVQEDLDKALVSKSIATVDTRATRIFHNPFNSTPVGSNGTVTGNYSVEVLTSTDDTLTVQQRATAAEQIDSYEQLMTSYDLMSQQARRQAYRISDYIDQYVLNMPVSKSGVRDVDSGFISSGANDGVGYAISSSNANVIANKITEMLGLGNAAINKGMFWVVSPYDRTKVVAFAQANGFQLSDSAISQGINGSAGKQFGGLDLYISNNLTHTTTIEIATEPTDGDTVTFVINGRTIILTAKTSATAAGQVKINGSAAGFQANLKLCLNGAGVGDGTDYFELATADRAALKMVSPQSAPGTFAICGSFSGNVATLTVYGSLSVASTLTAGSPDGFTAVVRHTIAGIYGSMFLALPADGMTFDMKSVTLKHGREVVTAQTYDATIWNNQKIEVLDVLVTN
jgi:hypothetical protein